MPRTPAIAAALILTLGCGTNDSAPRGFVSPLDGQTRVHGSQELVVQTRGLGFPEDQPLPQDAIRVTNLADGTQVKGEVWRDEQSLVFTPDETWPTGANFAWTVRNPRAMPREPQLTLPEVLLGTANFSTERDLQVLAAGVDAQGELCVLLSHRLRQLRGSLRLSVDGQARPDVLWTLRQERDLGDALPLSEGDAGVSLACWSGSVEVGALVELGFDDDPTWALIAEDLTAVELSIVHRRSSW